jgi:predicted nucleotidyltransferase
MNQFKINNTYEILLKILKKNNHGRQLAKELNISLSTIQRTLSELVSLNVIDYSKQGKNKIYFLKQNIISTKFILNSENYKLIKLLINYPFLEPLFREINYKYPKVMIILFGSYAKFNSKKDSDIDIYVNTTNKKIKKDIQSLHHKLSIKFGEFNKKDLLIQEIIKNHVIIQGGEKYYEMLKP